MIVDDNGGKGQKRKEIFNPNIKYIGISSIRISKSFICYFTFSEDINHSFPL